MSLSWKRAILTLAMVAATSGMANADRIKNPTAVFSGLDKITGRIVSFEVAVDETVQFGGLQMTPKVCFSRPPTESPNTTAFVEVDEVAPEAKFKRIFSGWLFAASPGLHGVEHPVYDLWLVECKGGTEIIAEPKEAVDDPVPVQPDPRARRQAEQQGEIMAPPTRLEAPQPQPVPVQRQPDRRFFPTNQAPRFNTDRTNDH